MKDDLLALSKKYGLSQMESRIETLKKQKLKIGLLGEFNSGKSTLINALLGTKVLPVMVKDTTKSITEIVPIDGEEKRTFFKKDEDYDDKWDEISGSEFGDIVMGKAEGTVKVVTPSSDYLKSDYLFIDTPGISSLSESDAEITFGYLPFLDGAVICQDINFGILTNSILQFITKPEVKPIINNFIFVLTKADNKVAKGATSSIREAVIDRLTKLNNEENLGLDNIDDKVVVASAMNYLDKNDKSSIDAFKAAMEKNIIGKSKKMRKERMQKELLNIAENIKSILEDRRDNLGLDDESLKAKENTLKADIAKIEEEQKKSEVDLELLKKELNKKLNTISQSKIPELKQAENEQIADMISELYQELNSTTQNTITKYFNQLESESISLSGLSSIDSFIKNINSAKDMTVTIATAAALAGIGSATGVAGNATEAAAGGGAKVAGDVAGKAAAGGGAKVAGDLAAKKLAKPVLKKILRGVATFIKDINPLEFVGDMSKQAFLDSSLTSKLKRITDDIAFETYMGLRNSLQRELFEPANEEIVQKQNSIDVIREERKGSKKDIEQTKQEIFDDILELKITVADNG